MVNSHQADISAQGAPAAADLGPLAWVLGETRKSIEAATKSLKRYAHDAEAARGVDLGSVDASQLRMARQQLHQVVGALDMVGQVVSAQMVRGMEGAVHQFVQHPERCTQDAALVIERAGFALVEYLETQLGDRPRSALGLFPQYRQVQEMAGADRVHPADLWSFAWRWVDPATAPAPQPLRYGADVRARLDQRVLKLMKHGDTNAAAEMGVISLGLADGESGRQPRIFWKLSAGFFEAVAKALIPVDVYVKRAASRILLQYTSLARGDQTVSERLAQDLLFFCAEAKPVRSADVPALAAVRQAWSLDAQPIAPYDQPTFGLYDPAVLAQARRRIDAVKENWSALAGGDMARMKACVDQFGLVAESLTKLHEQGRSLGDALIRAVQQTAQSGHPPTPELAMETATAVLFLEASFADFHPVDSKFAERAQQLTLRLDAVRGGAAMPPLEPWMEDLYRQVSDRQTMGTVVGELRSTLGEAEQHLDQFFRNPADTSVLSPVPGLLGQMRGVLSVLGLDQAALAVGRMRDTVESFLGTPAEGDAASVDTHAFEVLGNSLGALGFQIDMLGYQPVLARKLFVFDADSGELRYVAGRAQRSEQEVPGHAPAEQARAVDLELDLSDGAPAPSAPAVPELLLNLDLEPDTAPGRLESLAAQAALEDKPALASAAHRAADATRRNDEAALSGALEAVQRAAGTPPVAAEAASPSAQDDEAVEDDDLLDIFLEEAREVVQNGHAALEALAKAPGDMEQQTTLRRAFHTLKGSSRMVGLTEFGEAAWSMEQMLNAWLAEQKPMTEGLRALATEAMDAFGRWVEDIAAKRAGSWSAEPFRVSADAMRLRGEHIALQFGAVESVVLDAHAFHQGEAPAGMAAAPQLGEFDLPDLSLPELPAPDQTSSDTLGAAADPVAAASTPDAAALVATEFEPSAPVSTPAQPAPAPSTGNSDHDWTAIADALSSVGTDAGSAPALPSAGLGSEQVPPTTLSDATSSAIEAVAEPVPELEELPLLSLDLEEFNRLAGEPVAATLPEQPAAAPAGDARLAVPQHEPVAESLVVESTPEPLLEVESTAVAESESEPAPASEPASVVASEALAAAGPSQQEEAAYKQIGELRISAPLYNVYLGEADEWSRQLITTLSEWALELDRPIPEEATARAHSLAGSSATVGFGALSDLARATEHALERLHGQARGTPDQAKVLIAAAEDIRRVLHQFAAGLLRTPSSEVLAAVHALEPVTVAEAPAPTEKAQPSAATSASLDVVHALPQPAAPRATPAATSVKAGRQQRIGDDIDVEDAVDPDLFPIFEEEAEELLPQLSASLRQWVDRPEDRDARSQVLRALHTLKGSARLAGALRLGEMAHRTESEIETIGTESLTSGDLEPLLDDFDDLLTTFRRLQTAEPEAGVEVAAPPPEAPAPVEPAVSSLIEAVPGGMGAAASVQSSDAAAVPVQRGEVALPAALSLVSARAAANQAVRVRSQLLDRLVSQAGEVVTSRARLETEVGQLRSSLTELTGNLERLRLQLRDVELQAETQMQSRLAQSKDAQKNFDPLEFDRFTRMQELTRMMAESVNDVATVQRSLQRAVEASEDDLAAQARQSRELQRDLLRTRMVEFESISERLYRVVRQASKENGKQVRLDIVGGTIEMDRGILERMTPAFEHLLRNCVVHGIEPQAERQARGKDPVGLITIDVQQAANDVSVQFRDDGAGLNLARIRERGLQQGLLSADRPASDAEVANLIFASGFSTATQVTELAGRGVGMDVVRTEVQALGGRIETQTRDGRGASFRLVLPLTTAVTHVVMLRLGKLVIGVPSNLIEIVRRVTPAELQSAYESGSYTYADQALPFFWSGALLQDSAQTAEPPARSTPVVILRSADQRVAMHVDEVLGNQEVVVKALGPQLSRLPGLVAITALASGAVALIYNPVALAAVYGEQARALSVAAVASAELVPAGGGAQPAGALPAPHSDIPLVLVVDDSITVRRVTQRLLQREGYRVALAADGLQGLEKLQGERPAVVLSDIEMPRMDGFDFVRNIRADERLRDLPVIMITSRIAEKHREVAHELGVNNYLGKPYSEEELLGLIQGYVSAAAHPVKA